MKAQDTSEMTEDSPVEDASQELPEDEPISTESATVSQENDLMKSKKAKPHSEQSSIYQQTDNAVAIHYTGRPTYILIDELICIIHSQI